LPLAGIFYVLRSALIAMQWPAQSSFLQGAVDPRVRGTATSITLGFWSIANALLPALAGYLLDRRLLDLPLVLGILCYGLAALWFYLALRHTPLPEESLVHAVAGEEQQVEQALSAR
jgi:MFS family permease